MRRVHSVLSILAILCSCQSRENAPDPASASNVGAHATSAIAGDMTSRLTEQIGAAAGRSIRFEKDNSDYAAALEAAFKGWGYTVIANSVAAKDQKPIEISYSLRHVDGQILAYLATPSVALGRAYSVTGSLATASSPLSVMQRN